MKHKSQEKQILGHLLSGAPITPIDALNLFGCFRLAAVVFNLKAAGHDVRTTLIRDGKKTYARYHIPVEPTQQSLFCGEVNRKTIIEKHGGL